MPPLAMSPSLIGVGYERRPELGDPKWNRPGFAGTAEELETARESYRSTLLAPSAQECLARIAAAGAHQVVGLLCYEADERRCHRDVLLHALGPSGMPARGNG